MRSERTMGKKYSYVILSIALTVCGIHSQSSLKYSHIHTQTPAQPLPTLFDATTLFYSLFVFPHFILRIVCTCSSYTSTNFVEFKFYKMWCKRNIVSFAFGHNWKEWQQKQQRWPNPTQSSRVLQFTYTETQLTRIHLRAHIEPSTYRIGCMCVYVCVHENRFNLRNKVIVTQKKGKKQKHKIKPFMEWQAPTTSAFTTSNANTIDALHLEEIEFGEKAQASVARTAFVTYPSLSIRRNCSLTLCSELCAVAHTTTQWVHCTNNGQKIRIHTLTQNHAHGKKSTATSAATASNK